MTTTIGLVANVFNEVNALPGWLETHLPFFDDVRVLHAGPDGAYSDDGTLEILEKWHIPVEFCAIDEGFGVVRTKAIHMSPCEWVMLLDADERFYPTHRVLTCSGEGTPHAEVDEILRTYDFRDLQASPPDWNSIARLGANLWVDIGSPYDQGARLREILAGPAEFDAISTVRRHWHDFSFRRPTQNWRTDPDRQRRLVCNKPSIHFDADARMHEQLQRRDGIPWVFSPDATRGLFFDHFHFTFKRMEQEQRAHDLAIFDAIHAGMKPPKWKEFREKL